MCKMTTSQAVVYLGPSMPVEDARQICEADYRPPIRRGDLVGIPRGTVVAMIDGVFDRELAVSPKEVNDAIIRGVVIFGGASMGALRAVEVPGVIGIGRVFEWYREGIIKRDDEVALLFAESSGRALTVPSVNVRFAVERLCRLGTIDQSTGNSLITAALKIPYKERTYRSILEAAGMFGRLDVTDLIEMLQAHDLKYRDAQQVLEALDHHMENHEQCRGSAVASSKLATVRAETAQLQPRSEELLIWESGDHILHEDLLEFLAYTGKMRSRTQVLATRFANSGGGNHVSSIAGADAQSVLNSVVRRWGWMSSEEARVTLADLGLDLKWVDCACREEAKAAERVALSVHEAPVEFRRALLADLFLDGLTLKREAMRLGSLRQLARQSEGEPGPEELKEAETVLCKTNGEFSFVAVRRRWATLGFANESAQDEYVRLLARARRVGRKLVRTMKNYQIAVAPTPPLTRDFACGPCPKAAGESRFFLLPDEAEAYARRIGQLIGVTRVSMIGELGDLGGIQVAQAARPGNAWSSSYGSGKSRTAAGAIVGSIMEETEKWAQEQFRPEENVLVGSYAGLRSNGQLVDPATLDLPYDSVYHAEMQLYWHPCWDLLSCRKFYLPVDLLEIRCRKHDICFTRRGARKQLSTNGMGSGFSREEAILHGLCEYVERHAQRMAELLLSNPGGLGPHPYRFLDLNTASSAVQDIVGRLRNRAATVRVLDITSEIGIPTFFATITRELRRSDGYGAHPDPNTAIEMALLEAAQTIAGATAGGREDLSIHARSLGRHERPRPVSVHDAWFWLDPDAVYKPLSEVIGFTSGDVYADLNWCLDRLRAAGVQHALVVDLTPPGIEPATVVRVILPGMETNNPFYTGTRARFLLLRDLLPKWQ
jgi:ribosomal protein S12 methylthiotransferase accessory factor